MTLVAHTVAAESRSLLQRAIILDGMIAVSLSWIDQFGNLCSPGRQDSGLNNTRRHRTVGANQSEEEKGQWLRCWRQPKKVWRRDYGDDHYAR